MTGTAASADVEVGVELLDVAKGSFVMGSDRDDGYPADGEGPAHRVELAAFRIGGTTVTNRQFAVFVEDTGFKTLAETFGTSFVFAGQLPDDFPPTRGVAAAPWWREVPGADWRHPEGLNSDVVGRSSHPVVHVSWFDAIAYAAWAGLRLPSEAEWERAARGGRVGSSFPWGDEIEPDGEHRMNVFQGSFPTHNNAADGFAGTCPVRSYPPNGLGLFEVVGNVWEWCSDWFSPSYYEHSPQEDPAGPLTGTSRVMRGGSYLCHHSYCRRYRVEARSHNTPDSTASNIGFRVAAPASRPTER